MATTGGDGGVDGVDSRQFLLVTVCLVGVVAAAFLAPVSGGTPLTGSQSAPDYGGGGGGDDGGTAGETGSGGSEGGEGSGGGGDGTGGESGEEGGEGSSGGGDGTGGESGGEGDGDGSGSGGDATGEDDPGDGEPGGNGDGQVGTGDRADAVRQSQRDCHVDTAAEFTPGTDTVVSVRVGGEPATSVRVWFNDEFVGRTDDTGAVEGTVPYVTELTITVESPTDEPCTFSNPVGPDEPSAGLVSSGAARSGAAAAVVGWWADSATARQQSGSENGVNNSSEYDVASNVTLRVEGDRYPGANATLVAAVAGVPMADAAVTVDGDRVGRTDDRGRIRLTVPDSDRFTARVSRGEIAGERTFDTWKLAVGFAPSLAIPGERVGVTVTRGGDPAGNATVALNGQTLGETGPDGRYNLTLPATVGGTVRAATAAQTATVPLWRAYALTAGLSLLLGFLATTTTALTARRRDRESARRVAAFWAAVGLLFVGLVVGERVGLAVAAGVLALAGLFCYRRRVLSGGATTAGLFVGFLEWCKRRVLGVVGLLESAVDWLRSVAGRLAAWLRSLPSSLSGLAGRLGAWLRGLPGRLLTRVRALPLRAAAAVCLALGVVGAATLAFGPEGLLVSTVLVVVTALFWLYSRRENADEPAGPETTAQTENDATGTREGTAPALRQLWRRLAIRVLPSTWRTRTPAEVSRAAVEQGLPRGPVEALADAFRDVEYGGQPEEHRRDQASSAFERIEEASESDDEEATER